MKLNWILGVELYMLSGGIWSSYITSKTIKDNIKMEELNRKYPSQLIDMLYNKPLVFAMGCFVGLPGFILEIKDKIVGGK